MGLGHRPETLLGLLLLRRMFLPLPPTLPAHEPRPTGEQDRRHGRGSVLLAPQGLRYLDALLRRKHEHHLRSSAWYGRRPVRMFVGQWRRPNWSPGTASPLPNDHLSTCPPSSVPTTYMAYNMSRCVVRRLTLT